MRFYAIVLVVAWSMLIAGVLVIRDIDSRVVQENVELERRVTQLEIHDCGLRQYEDYSVGPQTSDEARLRCVGIMMGEIVCDERIVDTELYLGNCRTEKP